jgi:hypothetical protein
MKNLLKIFLIILGLGLVFASALNNGTAFIEVFAQINNPPNSPTSLAQYKSDCSTPIPAGGWTNETAVCLKGDISDPDAGDQIKLEVELVTSTQPFANLPTHAAPSYCISPCLSTTTASGLIDTFQYKWQARTIDVQGATSNWVQFNEGQVAFGIDLTFPTGTISANPTEVRANQNFNITVSGQDNIDMGAVCYKVGDEAGWTCQTCPGTSTSCSYTWTRSEGALGKYKYYGLVADAAENTNFTDPTHVFVWVETDPSVRTDSAIDVQTDRATLKGELLDTGGAPAVEVWFDYGLTESYGNESSHITLSATGTFSITITGLSPGTEYHFRARAKNGVGTAYGSDGEFVTFIELIKNGGFEMGDLSYWTSVGTGNHEVSTEDVHSGTYSGLIGYKTAPIVRFGKSAIYQEVTIPSGSTNIQLSLWYKFYTTDKCPYDYINIYLKDTSNNILKTYLQWCCDYCTAGQLNTYGWNQITDNDLLSFAGQTVRVYFEVENRWDTFHRSWAFIDDVSLRYIPTYPPSVQTKDATGVKTNEAVLNGELLDMGRANSVEVWFQYGTTTSYGLETSHVFQNSTGPFSSYVSGLSANTTYHFRAVAKNGSGTTYGNDFTFTTQEAAAGGWILADNFEDPEGKWANEMKGSDGNIQTYAEDWSNRVGWGAYIVYTLNTPTKSNKVRVNADFTPDKWAKTDMVEVGVFYEGDTDFTTVFQGQILDCDWSEITFPEGKITKARFRWHYGASGYIYWLYEFQFYKVPEVPITLPSVVTNDPTSIEEKSAILHGQVTDDGGETVQYRFEYGTSTDYGFSTPWEGSLGSGATFGRMVTNLQEGVTYHFHAQVKNSAGVTSGADKTFFTQPAPAGWVSPTTSSDPDGKWTNEHYAFDDELDSYTRSYHGIGDPVWSSYLYLSHKEISSDRIRFNARGGAQVDAAIIDVYKDNNWVNIFNGAFADRQWVEVTFPSGKVSQARIQFHAKSSNEGFYWQLYEFDFYKLPELPSVETVTSTHIGTKQATLVGKLTDMGGVSSVNVWFEYGTSTAYGSTTTSTAKTAIGTFSETVTGLEASTIYHFRAVAQNVAGTVYGADMTFTTLGACLTGATTTCTSTEGCEHTITCEDGAWPPCPRDECTKNTTDTSDCPCPQWECKDLDGQGVNNDLVYYGNHPNFCGDCTSNCTCNTSTAPGQPCEEHISYNDSTYCNQPPLVATTSVDLGDWCYCYTDINPIFSWNYQDYENNPQDSYQVQISTTPDFSSIFIDSCISPEPQTCDPGHSSENYRPITSLEYNTTYYWRVKVKDISGAWSTEWATGTSFTTTPHRWPRPDFTISPSKPSVNEVVTFVDSSECYDDNNNPYPCSEINPIKNTYNIYLWEFGDGATSSERGTTTHSYSQAGNYMVRLHVTDVSLSSSPTGTCVKEFPIIVSLPLPKWKEIAPP